MNSKNIFYYGLLIIIVLSVAVTYMQSKKRDQCMVDFETVEKEDWCGLLELNGGAQQLALVVHVMNSKLGQTKASIDCLQQGLVGLSVDALDIQDGIFKFEIKKLNATYEGTFNKEHTQVTGVFTQGGTQLPLVFNRTLETKEIMPLQRSQEPQMPYPYHEEEVNYISNNGDIVIAGTLTVPYVQQQPCPAVLLVAGSGPQDRNESVCGHKPFMVLADHLTRQGIAVLRVDKRGVGASTGDYESATSVDFALDVQAGINYLKTRKEINSEQIGLVGHSEGGVIAPMVATQSQDVAFMVLLAAPGVTGEEIICEQTVLMQRVSGVSEDIVIRSHMLQKRLFEILKNEPDRAIVDQQLRQALLQDLAESPEEQQQPPHKNILKADSVIKVMTSNWMKFFAFYEPAAVLKQVKISVLVISGERDLQVSPQQNIPVIVNALKESENKDYTVLELPQLNHLLQTCKTGSIEEYALIEETMAPVALDTISQWILKRTA